MESKICTYTEKNVRLQLVRVDSPILTTLEIRLNRKILKEYEPFLADEAKLYFIHCCHKILMDRNMSDLTM